MQYFIVLFPRCSSWQLYLFIFFFRLPFVLFVMFSILSRSDEQNTDWLNEQRTVSCRGPLEVSNWCVQGYINCRFNSLQTRCHGLSFIYRLPSWPIHTGWRRKSWTVFVLYVFKLFCATRPPTYMGGGARVRRTRLRVRFLHDFESDKFLYHVQPAIIRVLLGFFVHMLCDYKRIEVYRCSPFIVNQNVY